MVSGVGRGESIQTEIRFNTIPPFMRPDCVTISERGWVVVVCVVRPSTNRLPIRTGPFVCLTPGKQQHILDHHSHELSLPPSGLDAPMPVLAFDPKLPLTWHSKFCLDRTPKPQKRPSLVLLRSATGAGPLSPSQGASEISPNNPTWKSPAHIKDLILTRALHHHNKARPGLELRSPRLPQREKSCIGPPSQVGVERERRRLEITMWSTQSPSTSYVPTIQDR